MREGLIRRAVPLRRAVRAGVRASLWLVLALAAIGGGEWALTGFLRTTDGELPQGLIAAEARIEEPPSYATLSLQGRIAASPYPPQVLSPVTAHGFPDWLTTHPGSGTDLRGIETDADKGGNPLTASAVGPAIAIVIDDLGADVAATRRAVRLPSAVTLSFLPYPDATAMLAREGESRGHQILVHVPMEPEGRDDPGPNALYPELSRAEIVHRLAWDLDRVPGFSGINNHMGSRFTVDRTALLPVVEMLADRHVFFLDSRTTPQSVVVTLARQFGVASASRDVFLDDDDSAGAVAAQLALTERIAQHSGTAIAIGHPHAATLAALEAWTAQLKGFALVPVSAAIRRKTEQQTLASLRD